MTLPPLMISIAQRCVLALCAVWLVGCGANNAQIISSRYVTAAPEAGLAQGCSANAPAKKWAVIIGVNFYADDRIPDLGGAVNDAWSFYHFLASPSGGAVDAHRLQLLLNDDATRKNVEGALGNFLGQACPQDNVIDGRSLQPPLVG